MWKRIDLTGQVFGKLTVVRDAGIGKHRNALWECRCECGMVKAVSGNSLRHGRSKSCGKSQCNGSIVDITGQVFGKLTVMKLSHIHKGIVYWTVRCECGIEKIVRAGALKKGDIKSCGKAPCVSYFKDITGQVFGMLTAKRFVGTRNGNAKWECQCACGNIVVTNSMCLKNGYTLSCGCMRGNQNFRHGHATNGVTSKEYNTWMGNIARSTRGQRGVITPIHPAWRDIFEQFLADVGPAPSPKHQLRRIDLSRGVEPGNVRWVGPAQERPF